MVAKKRKRIPWGWIVVGLLVVGGGGYSYWQSTNSQKASELPTGVQVGKAETGEISQKITASGVVAAQVGAKANIGSQIAGLVRSLPADVGAKVRAGQVVAVLDAPDLQAQVEQQRQNVSVSRASLEGAESRLRQARLNAELSVNQTRNQIAEAEFARRAAQQRLKLAQANTELQPTQVSSEIERAEAALSTAKSQEVQVKQTVNLQLLQAKTNVDEARAAAVNSERIVRRQQALLSRGFISRQEVDDSRTSLQQTQARFQSAQANANIVKEKTAADLQTAQNQVAQAEASLRVAKANTLQGTMRAAEEQNAREAIRQAEATLALRRANKTQDLIRKRAVEEARAAVLQARASVKQTEAALRFQEAQLDRAIIRSPLTGTVLTVATQQGETVAAGFQVQTLITVADLNRLEVRAYVDEVDIGQTRLGLPAEIRVESFPNRVFQGKVSKVAAASTVKDNVVTYETTIALENREGLLRPDMTADVTLVLGRRPNVRLVPTEAVHREVDRSVVYVLHREKQGPERVETRAVTTGVQDGSHTQILTGLKDGEEVVLAGLQRLGVKAKDSQDAEGKKEDQ